MMNPLQRNPAETTMEIPFTQYLLPDGRTRAGKIKRPDDIGRMAQRLLDSGCRFEMEILRTGEVSMTVERDPIDDDDDGVLAMEVCANGPEVPTRVDKMITDAAALSGDKR